MESTDSEIYASSGEADVAEGWRAAVLEALMRGGPVCQNAAEYILDHDVRIGFAKQRTAARWTLRGDIELNSGYYSLETSPASPRLLGSIVHETRHVEQGVALALSVEGEVDAWRAEYQARSELEAPLRDPHWEAVALTPDSPTDQGLRQARSEMLKMAGHRYLIWLLPLRPNVWTRLVAGLGRLVFGRETGR